MRATHFASFTVGLWVVLAGCQDLEQCKDPGRVDACACGEGVVGTRVCEPEQTWSECSCGGDSGVVSGGSGGMTGGMGGMTGGMGGMTGGMGGMTGGTGGMSGSDGGMEPDAGSDAEVPDDGNAYAGCTEASVATDCPASSTCIESDMPFLGESGFVCGAPCTMVEDCPAPEDATSDATVACEDSRCRLSCSNLNVTACPAGMTCILEAGGTNEYCYVVP